MDGRNQELPDVNARGRAIARPRRLLAALALIAVAIGAGCGPTTTAVTLLEAPAPQGSVVGDPAIMVEPGKNGVLLAWLAGDTTGVRLWFARSDDRGAHWSAPVAVTPEGEPLRLHPEGAPVFVSDANHRVGLAWSTSVEIEGRRFPASDLRFARSLDGGATWGAPVTLNDDTTSGPGSHTFHDVTRLPDGRLVAAWLDSRPPEDGTVPNDSTEGHDSSIRLAGSLDFGATWSPNEAHASHVCPCCRVDIATDLVGTTFIAYRRHFPGQIRDIVMQGPKGAPVRAFPDQWNIGGCPHAGPAMRIAHDGTMRVVWFTGAEGRAGLWFKQSVPSAWDSTAAPLAVLTGEKLSASHASLIDGGPAGSLIAVDTDESGARNLTLVRVAPNGRAVTETIHVPGTHGTSHPRVAGLNTSADGYVAWMQGESGDAKLRLLRWDLRR